MVPPTSSGLFFWSWKEILQSCRRPATYLPFLAYFAVQLLILGGLFWFVYSPFSYIFLPLLRTLYGEHTVHYPNNLIVMPQIFETVNMALSGLFGVWVVGRATTIFFNSEENKAKRKPTAAVRKHYFHLLGAWLGETALAMLLIWALAGLSEKFPAGAAYLAALRMFGVIGVGALCAFRTALIVIEGMPFWTALAQSAKLFTSYGAVTYCLLAFPTLILLPLQYLLSYSAKIAFKLNPEVIAWIVAAGMIVAIVSNYFIVSGVTHLYRGISHETKAPAAPRPAKVS